IDWYLVAILAMVGLATVLPARGAGAVWAGRATTVAIGLLFFLYGARLSGRAAWDGLRHWRLHGVVLLSTFALFPLLGLATRALASPRTRSCRSPSSCCCRSWPGRRCAR